MKRISSILLACVIGILSLATNLTAQTYNGGAGPVDWQDPITWGIPNYWPGRNNDNSSAIFLHTAATTINNATPTNRISRLVNNANSGITLNGTGTLTIGALNLNTAQPLTIGAGLTVVIDSIIDGAANSTIIVNAGGRLILRRGVGAPTNQIIPGGTTIAASSINAEVILENGFNNGEFPVLVFTPTVPTSVYTGLIRTQGNFTLNENFTRAAAQGQLDLGGTLTVSAGVTLTLNQTSPNSLIGTGTIQSVVGGVVALGAGFNAGITPGQRFASPFFGQLQTNGVNTIDANMTFGVANGTIAQQGTLSVGAAANNTTVAAGVTVTLNGTINNSLTGLGFLTAAAGGTIVLGPNFNGGLIPPRFAVIQGTLRTEGALQWLISNAPAANLTPFSSTATLDIGGNLDLLGAGTLIFSQTGVNSITARNGGRISAQGLNTLVYFAPNANNGIIPGNVFARPYDGGFLVSGQFQINDTLRLSANSGSWTFVNHGSIVTIGPNAELGLARTLTDAVNGLPRAAAPAAAAGNGPGNAISSYFQGAGPSSVLRLAQGFNGGNIPSGDFRAANTAAAPVGAIPFLPFPFQSATAANNLVGFQGRLILEGTFTMNRNLRIGANGILDLAGGNLQVAALRTLQLYNQATNSLTGTGFVQAVAPTRNLAGTIINAPTLAAIAATDFDGASGSQVEIGPGFNGAVLNAARFANPFQGNLDISTAGSITLSGDFVSAIPGGFGYFIVGRAGTGNIGALSETTSGTTRLTIAANSSLRLNGINPGSFYGGAQVAPSVSPITSIQGTDVTSRVIIGTGHNAENVGTAFNGVNVNSAYARVTNATFLASPFNGTLQLIGNTYLTTEATIGVNSALVVGGNLILRNLAINNPFTARGDARGISTTLAILSQAAGSISGLGTIQAGTGNTVILGAAANGGILPAARFANPYFGTIASVSATRLQGFFQLGDSRDGAPVDNTGMQVSSGFIALGAGLTVDAGSVLTVSNATTHAIIDYSSLSLSTNINSFPPRFNAATSGTATIDAEASGEIRFADGYASLQNGSSSYPYASTAVPIAKNFFNNGAAGAGTGAANQVIVPSRSNIRGEYFATPFRGRLSLGTGIGTAPASSPGGQSRINLTSGTLTMGPTSVLNLVGPLFVSSGTTTFPLPLLTTNGLPRLVLNMTGANSLVGATTGSVINSSVGTFSVFGGVTVGMPFFQNALTAGQQVTAGTGGTVTLGPGFNGGTISAQRFANPFSGFLRLADNSTYTLVGTLNMNAPSAGVGLAQWTNFLNYGILDLGTQSAAAVTPTVTISDGSSLRLGTTGTSSAQAGAVASPGHALLGTGTIQGATNNASLTFAGTFGALSAGSVAPAGRLHVTGANIFVPFNGRMIVSTNNSANLVGNLTIGAQGTANGILEISPEDVTVTVPPFGQPLFVIQGSSTVAVDGKSPTLTLNNTSPVAVVLPGIGGITATSNFQSVVLGPNALGNILPANKLANPFFGRLIVNTTATGSAALATSAPFTLAQDLTLGEDFANTVAVSQFFPGLRNGFLQINTNLNINSGITLAVRNAHPRALSSQLAGSGTIQGADGNSTVRFFASAWPFGGNGNIVPGDLFRNPYNGNIALSSVENVANTRHGYHLYGGLTIGGVGTSNGFLNVSGATLYLAAAGGVAATGTEATLTINNTLPVETVLPGGGAIYPKGEIGGNANNRNSRLIYGLGSLGGIIPFHKSTSGSASASATTLPLLPTISDWAGIGISGTIITPNASVTATNASVAFANGGTLVIGGATTATYSTTAELVLSNAAQRLTFGSTHLNALGGLGTIRATVTDATVRFNNLANASIVPGYNFAQNFLGTIAYEGNMTQTGIIRLGNGSATTGRLTALNTAGAQYLIGGGATLDLRTVTNGVGNTGATIAGGLIAAANGTSTLILHPNFATNVGVGTATPSLINQGQTLLATPFNGVLIASTGTTTVDFGNLTIGATGALEIGGDFIVPATRTLVMNQNTANSFRRTGSAGGAGTGLLLANPTNTAGVATVQLGPSFNNSVLPVNLLGSASGVPNEFGAASGTPVATLEVNGGAQLTLSSNSASVVAPANFIVRGDLNFTNQGGGIIIPTQTTMQVLAGFSAAATAAPISQGYIQGTTGIGSSQSVLSIGAGTRNAGNALSATTPVIGGIRNAAVANVPAFTGVLRFQGNGAINGVSVTIGTTSGLDLPGANTSLNVQATSNLNMLNQGANSYTFASGAAINGTAATSSVNLGAGFNGGLLPGAGFTAAGFQGNLTMGGGAAAPGGPLTLSSNLTIGNAGIFDFVGNANKLTLSSFNAVVAGTLRNSGTTQYFITNGTGTAGLGNVGNVTFPVGPSATVFAPININNNGSPAIFSVRALGAVAQAAPFATGSAVLRQSIVNQQWNVTQNTNVTPGFSVTVTPLWLAGQENGGFNRNLAVTNAFTTTSGTISSGAGAAASDPNFTGYFRSGVTVTQIATNNLNNTPILVSSQPSPGTITFTPPAQSSGATLTIVGARLAPGASVSLGGIAVPAGNVTLVPGGTSGIDTLRVVVPSNAASGNVVVTQTGGSSTAMGFTFLGAPLQLPVIRTVTPSPIPAGLGDVEVTITGTAFGVLTPRVVAVGSGITSTITPSANSTTRLVVTVPGNVVRNIGSVVFTVTSLDRLPVSTTVTVSTPPALVLTSLAPASTSGNLRAFTIRVNGNNFSAQSLFSLGSTSLRVMGVIRNNDGTLTALVEVPVGAVSGNLNVLNLNGQSASLPFVINSLPRPVITNVSPNILPPGSPNTTITINGRNLIPGATVSFNGQQLTGVQLTGDSLLTVVIPASLLATPDLGVLTITNPDGQSIGYRLPVTVGAPGAVTISQNGVSPSSTTGTGSAFALTITGTGFNGPIRVSLGGTFLTVVSTTPTSIVVNVPANLNFAGTYVLQVINSSNVTANANYTILPASNLPAPAITRVTPAQASNDGGNITITGSNFVTGARVQLGSVQLTVVSVNASTIVATIPAGTAIGNYDLRVTNPDGQFALQTYLVVTSVSNEPLAGIRVYPNPVVEAVSVEANLERAAKVVITVTNSLGQRVMVVEQNAAAGFFSRSLNINSLPSGAYMVEITDGARRSVEKIIKN